MGFSIVIAILSLIILCINHIKRQQFLKLNTLLNQETTGDDTALKISSTINGVDIPNQTANKENLNIKKMYYNLRNKLSTNAITNKSKVHSVKENADLQADKVIVLLKYFLIIKIHF